MQTKIWLTLFTIVLGGHSTAASDWPGFRGPHGNGVTVDRAPVEWSDEENVVWRVALPQPGNGSPIVVGDRVLVTCAEDELGKRRSTYCFDRKTGKERWVRTVDLDKVMPHHKTNPHGSSTPVSDGERIVVWHASAGLHCYNMYGKELWSRDLGEFRHMWGYGSSPVIYKNKVILYTGPGESSFVIALDLQTGKTLWQHNEPEAGTVDRREDGAPHGSWSTPVIARVDGRDQIIVMLPKRVVSYDADSGEIIWTCAGLRHDRGDLAYSSPVIAGDLCFVTGGYKGPSMSIRLEGRGNVTESHRLFRIENSPQSIGSGVFVGGYVYRPNAEAGKGLQCLDPKTGEIKWSQRSSAAHWGSMVLSEGRLYVTGQDGTTLVFAPNPEIYVELAENELGEICNSTPAISAGQIFIRTDEHLYCIGS
jgi:outer membrane protein assembly factor BamB